MEITEFPNTSHRNETVWRPATLFRDRFPVVYYDTHPDGGGCAAGRALIVCNALGFPASYLEPFVQRASGKSRVVGWDMRCMPGPGIQDFAKISVGTHCEDLIHVIEHLGLRRIVFAGYCNGAEVALQTTRMLEGSDVEVAALILFNGYYSFREKEVTQNSNGLLRILRDIEKKPSKAARYHKALNKITFANAPVPEEDLRYPFRFDSEKIHRLSTMFHSFEMNDIESWVGAVGTPCVSLVAKRDDVSHPGESSRIAELLPDAEAVAFESAEHYAVYNDVAFQDYIVRRALEALG